MIPVPLSVIKIASTTSFKWKEENVVCPERITLNTHSIVMSAHCEVWYTFKKTPKPNKQNTLKRLYAGWQFREDGEIQFMLRSEQ